MSQSLERARKLSFCRAYCRAAILIPVVFLITKCLLAQVVVNGALDYSSKEVQVGLEELLVQLENTTYIDPVYTESWLRSFLDYVERWRDYPDYDQLKTGDEQSFIRTLKDVSKFCLIFSAIAGYFQL